METLEIKHLAAYLPYKINLQYIIRDRVVKTGIMKTIIHNEADTHPTKISIDWDDAEHIWMFKPILRPLSDLTKEIEVDGKRFVPIDIFEISDSENADEYDFGNVYIVRKM